MFDLLGFQLEPTIEIPLCIVAMKSRATQLIIVLTSASLLAVTRSHANDGFNSELSHFAGNLAIASVSTVAIDKFLPKVKKPALAGFIVSASEAALGELAERALGQGKISLLDIAAGTLGAAVGAYATDKWYIQPRLDTRKGETTASLMVVRRF